MRIPWLPQRGELATESTERGKGKTCADSIIPLSASLRIGTSPHGARQGELRKVSQGKKDFEGVGSE